MRYLAYVIEMYFPQVIFVDSRLDDDVNPSEAVEVFEAPEPITLGEAPLPAFETADSAPETVRFVDSPVDVAPVAEEIIPEAVRFVDSPVEVAPVAAEIVPEAVRFVDSPVEVAPVAEEIVPDAVRFVDAPLDVAPVAEEIAAEPVQIA